MDWTPSPTSTDKLNDKGGTVTHVAAGDRHGRPDTGPHMKSAARHHANGNGHAPNGNLSPVQEKGDIDSDKEELGVAGDRHANGANGV